MAIPSVLLMHEVPHQGEPADLASEIRKRSASIDLSVATDYQRTLDLAPDSEIIITRELQPQVLAKADSLQWVQALNAGVDSYDLDELDARDVILTNASGIHSIPIAEQVLGYMLAFERGLLRGFEQQQRREWYHFVGGELHDKSVGVVGLGDIGKEIAQLCDKLGMEVLGIKRDTNVEVPEVTEIYSPDELHTVAGKSDYFTLACPLTSETRDWIDLSVFESMSPDAVFINIARGEIVVEKDLIVAVNKGKIGGAALDVQRTEPLPPDSPLWSLPNVVLTPHMAGSTPNYLDRCAEIFVTNHDRFISEEYSNMSNRIL